jgi:hypothetical protein
MRERAADAECIVYWSDKNEGMGVIAKIGPDRGEHLVQIKDIGCAVE